MNDENEDEKISKICQFYFNNSNFIHITLKRGGWYNGEIFSISSDFIEFNDREDGLMILFFSEIKEVTLFREDKNHGN